MTMMKEHAWWKEEITMKTTTRFFKFYIFRHIRKAQIHFFLDFKIVQLFGTFNIICWNNWHQVTYYDYDANFGVVLNETDASSPDFQDLGQLSPNAPPSYDYSHFDVYNQVLYFLLNDYL